MNGRVPVEGVDLTCLNLQIEEIFFRQFNYRDFDVSEVSMGKYCSLVSQGNSPLVAIPVFPSRVPRHSSIYIRRDGPVKSPADLAGKRIGIPEWAQTAAVYSRGLLQHQYGIDLASIQWIQAGVDQPGRLEKVKLNLPPGIDVHADAGQEPERHAGVGRDRRRAVGASAGLLRARPSERDSAVSGLSRDRAEIRQGNRHLSDHARAWRSGARSSSAIRGSR